MRSLGKAIKTLQSLSSRQKDKDNAQGRGGKCISDWIAEEGQALNKEGLNQQI